MLLAEHFAQRMSSELGLDRTPGFSRSTVEIINSHSWPGNIRELKNVIERAVYKCTGDSIDELTLDPFRNPYEEAEIYAQPGQQVIEKTVSTLPKLQDFRSNIREIEISYLRRALEESSYNQRDAAVKLSLTYDQFRGLYRKYREEL